MRIISGSIASDVMCVCCRASTPIHTQIATGLDLSDLLNRAASLNASNAGMERRVAANCHLAMAAAVFGR